MLSAGELYVSKSLFKKNVDLMDMLRGCKEQGHLGYSSGKRWQGCETEERHCKQTTGLKESVTDLYLKMHYQSV